MLATSVRHRCSVSRAAQRPAPLTRSEPLSYQSVSLSPAEAAGVAATARPARAAQPASAAQSGAATKPSTPLGWSAPTRSPVYATVQPAVPHLSQLACGAQRSAPLSCPTPQPASLCHCLAAYAFLARLYRLAIPRLSQPACVVAQPPAPFSPPALPLSLPLSPARATHQPSIPRHHPRLRHSAIHTAWLVSAIQPAYAIAQSAAPLSRPHHSAGPRRPVRLRSSARYAAQSAPTARLICAVQPARVIQSPAAVAQSAAVPLSQPSRSAIHTAWLVSAIQPAYAIAQSAAPLSRPHHSAGPRRPVRLRSSARYAAQSAPTARLICAVQPARVIQSTAAVAQSAAVPLSQPSRATQPAIPCHSASRPTPLRRPAPLSRPHRLAGLHRSARRTAQSAAIAQPAYAVQPYAAAQSTTHVVQ
eukprot:CAMPEP_0118959866 /NCGR_PEP_ID=MMETSP1169-20130426/63344_1 /TAXON_ID=36882 /ORGANISM="Pyramimonas obovata, Strain CCMP722" /LENGTH=417 /DNA_ID=CAMNT_0006908007 /DNA_START=926 /DNA_END=2178 /DNA_ORIENTATION=+